MRFNLNALAWMLLSAALISGCGQKGPLYLPGEDASTDTDAPAESNPLQHESEKRHP